jgi:hypothetical protein
MYTVHQGFREQNKYRQHTDGPIQNTPLDDGGKNQECRCSGVHHLITFQNIHLLYYPGMSFAGIAPLKID